MEITTQLDGKSAVVILNGDLDVNSSAAVEDTVKKLLGDKDGVIIDIAGVPFADSSGLGGLISAYKKAKELGKEIRLRHPTPVVLEILTITRMRRFFPIDEA